MEQLLEWMKIIGDSSTTFLQYTSGTVTVVFPKDGKRIDF